MSETKTVLITGCSSGIGYVTAHELRKAGFNVICSARQETDIERLRQEGFTTLYLDLSISASIRSAVDQLVQLTQGEIYAVFHNGAYGQPGAVEDLSREVLTQQFETNFFGTHELTNLLLPLMRSAGRGRVIYNSSILGLVAMRFRGAYNASKYAIEGLADTLRLELIGTGIEVVLIEPGPIESDFRKNALIQFKAHVNAKDSVHRSTYEKIEARLQKEGAVAPFTLPAEAVARKVLHALTAKKPKIRYYVTFPTYLLTGLKRILPMSWMDYLLTKIE